MILSLHMIRKCFRCVESINKSVHSIPAIFCWKCLLFRDEVIIPSRMTESVSWSKIICSNAQRWSRPVSSAVVPPLTGIGHKYIWFFCRGNNRKIIWTINITRYRIILNIDEIIEPYSSMTKDGSLWTINMLALAISMDAFQSWERLK